MRDCVLFTQVSGFLQYIVWGFSVLVYDVLQMSLFLCMDFVTHKHKEKKYREDLVGQSQYITRRDFGP